MLKYRGGYVPFKCGPGSVYKWLVRYISQQSEDI